MSLEAQRQWQHQPLHILMTGSSQGIGLAAAKRLVREGHIVYHASRTEGRAQQAVEASGGGVPLVCDLTDFDSIRKCAPQIPPLDVVVFNAGVSGSASPPALTKQGLEACIGVNHFGHFLLLQLLWSQLWKKPAKVVWTASSVHDPAQKAGQSGGTTATLGDLSGLGVNLLQQESGSSHGPAMVDGSEYDGGKVYKDSKLCNILTCRHLAKIGQGHIQSVCFNPGFVPTTGLFDGFRQENWFRAQALTVVATLLGFAIPVEVAGDRLVTMITSDVQNGCYMSAPAKSRGTTPTEGFVVTPVSEEASCDELAARLWERSMEIVREWL